MKEGRKEENEGRREGMEKGQEYEGRNMNKGRKEGKSMKEGSKEGRRREGGGNTTAGI